jgi:hypothetical protein
MVSEEALHEFKQSSDPWGLTAVANIKSSKAIYSEMRLLMTVFTVKL